MVKKAKGEGKGKALADLDLDRIAGGVEEECPRGPDAEELARFGDEQDGQRGPYGPPRPRVVKLGGGSDARKRKVVR